MRTLAIILALLPPFALTRALPQPFRWAQAALTRMVIVRLVLRAA
jgi:hypothetical protein